LILNTLRLFSSSITSPPPLPSSTANPLSTLSLDLSC
jgi:hypothetical protein